MQLQHALWVTALLFAITGCDRAPQVSGEGGDSGTGGTGGHGGAGGTAGEGVGGTGGSGGVGGTGGIGGSGGITIVPGDLPTSCSDPADVPGPCDGAFCFTEGPAFSWTNDADSPAPGQLRVLGHVDLDYRIALFDGSRWSWETPPFDGLIRAFAAPAADDIWAVGNGVFRLDGSVWREVEMPVPTPQTYGFTDIVARAADDIWVSSRSLETLLHWDGAAWTQHAVPVAAHHLFFDEDGGLWLQGDEEIARQDGDGWQVYTLGSKESPIVQLGGSLSDGLFVTREKQPLMKWNGSGFTAIEIPDFNARHVASWDGAVWFSGHDPVADENALYRWIDGTLEKLEVPGGRVYLGDLVDAGTALWSLGAFDISRWDGSCWQVHARSVYEPSIAGSSEEDLWAFGGGVTRWNGTSWRPVDAGIQAALHDAWTAGPGEVWAVGEGGTVLRVKDEAFSQMGTGSMTAALATIDGTGPDDVWVAGADGAAWHWNGTSWEDRTIPGGWTIVDIAAAGNEVWAIGARRVGSDFEPNPDFDSVAMRWNGAGWDEMRSDLRQLYLSLAIRADGDVWIFGDGFALRWHEGAWEISNPAGKQLPAHAMWIDEDGAWFGDDHGFYSLGAQPTAPHLLPRGVRALCRDGGDATWMLDGLGRVHRFAGGVLETMDAPPDMRFIACGGPNEVWFASWSVLARWDGTRIAQVDSFPGNAIGALWSRGAGDLWVVGNSKPIHWDGVGFSEVSVPGIAVYAVHGSAADDIWAVGSAGGASHWDGTSWTLQRAPTTDGLTDVWSFGPGNAWARTGSQELLHWDGSSWTPGWEGDLAVHAIAGHDGALWISGYQKIGVGYDVPRFYVYDASGTWSPAEHAVWGYGWLGRVLVGADGTLSGVADRTYVRSGADPTAPWHATELPVWASELLWQDAAGVAWLRTSSGLVRWDGRE